MGAILKLTAAVYLLMGLGMNASLVSYGSIKNPDRTSVQELSDRLTVVPIIIAQDEPPPPPPGKGAPGSRTQGAGGRCVEEILDVTI